MTPIELLAVKLIACTCCLALGYVLGLIPEAVKSRYYSCWGCGVSVRTERCGVCADEHQADQRSRRYVPNRARGRR